MPCMAEEHSVQLRRKRFEVHRGLSALLIYGVLTEFLFRKYLPPMMTLDERGHCQRAGESPDLLSCGEVPGAEAT